MTIETEPTINNYNIGDEDAGAYVKRVLGELVDKFAMVSGPTSTADGMHCPYCHQVFKKINNMRKHVIANHEAPLPQNSTAEGAQTRSRSRRRPPTQQPVSQQEDSVHNYSCTALGLCLLCLDFLDAVKRADGARIIRLYKFFLLYFKVSGKSKYAFHSLRLLVQLQILSPRLSHQLTWNRFINLAGRPDSNFSMDLLLEFYNKVFKEDCRGFRGKVTEDAVTRVSRAAQRLDEILHRTDKSGDVKKRSGRHAKQDVTDDVLALIESQHREKLFSFIPGRFHRAFPAFPRNPLEHLNFASLQKWMSDKLKVFSRVKVFQKL